MIAVPRGLDRFHIKISFFVYGMPGRIKYGYVIE